MSSVRDRQLTISRAAVSRRITTMDVEVKAKFKAIAAVLAVAGGIGGGISRVEAQGVPGTDADSPLSQSLPRGPQDSHMVDGVDGERQVSL
jgi:hypothetical protein